MNVHTWSEENVSTILENLVTHCCGELFNTLGVPHTCENGTYRETCTEISVRIVFTSWRDAQTCRTVREDSRRNAKALDRTCCTCCTWYEGSCGSSHTACCHATPTATYEQGCLLFKCHGCHNLVDVVFCQLWLCEHSHRT